MRWGEEKKRHYSRVEPTIVRGVQTVPTISVCSYCYDDFFPFFSLNKTKAHSAARRANPLRKRRIRDSDYELCYQYFRSLPLMRNRCALRSTIGDEWVMKKDDSKSSKGAAWWRMLHSDKTGTSTEGMLPEMLRSQMERK